MSDINNLFVDLQSMLSTTGDTTKDTLAQLEDDMKKQGGTLNPIQMNQIQMLFQTYTSLVTTFSSLTKLLGDMNKGIAQNMGA